MPSFSLFSESGELDLEVRELEYYVEPNPLSWCQLQYLTSLKSADSEQMSHQRKTVVKSNVIKGEYSYYVLKHSFKNSGQNIFTSRSKM